MSLEITIQAHTLNLIFIEAAVDFCWSKIKGQKQKITMPKQKQ